MSLAVGDRGGEPLLVAAQLDLRMVVVSADAGNPGRVRSPRATDLFDESTVGVGTGSCDCSVHWSPILPSGSAMRRS